MLARSLCKYLLIVAAFLPGLGSAQEAPRVKISTSSGDIVVELYPEKAPRSVDNFMQYVRAGHYTGTIFHRVIPGFMIQGGGFDISMNEKPTRGPIPLETNNGLRNDRGTLAMARTADPSSATAQFFINLVDNPSLNAPQPDGHGYAVFGRVVSGMNVVDAIGAVATTTVRNNRNVPVMPITITAATVDTATVQAATRSSPASPGIAPDTSPGSAIVSRQPDSRRKSALSPDSGVAASSSSRSSTPATTTPDSKTLASAKPQERKAAPTSCPVETTIVGDYEKVQTLKFGALREKMLTRAELESYYEALIETQKEASTNVQSNGLRIYTRYGYTDTPKQRALLGCVEGMNNNCADLVINREPPRFQDTISPRVAVYQCHHDAGWPSATDAPPARGRGVLQAADTPSGKRQATAQEKPSETKREDDRAPYIARKCVRIVQGGKGVADAYKRIQNDCGIPVTVAFCLEAPGPINECLNRNRYGLSDIIPAGKHQLTADAIQGPWTAWSFVCDMSNPKRQTCLPPKNIAGEGAFRD